MGVPGEREEMYLSHDPETDNDNAIRTTSNKGQVCLHARERSIRQSNAYCV